MTAPTVPISVARALDQAGFSQRKAAELTGISQPTLLAQVTGVPLASLTGRGTGAARGLWAARAVDGAAMEEMRRTLIGYLELDAYLADQAIPRAC